MGPFRGLPDVGATSEWEPGKNASEEQTSEVGAAWTGGLRVGSASELEPTSVARFEGPPLAPLARG